MPRANVYADAPLRSDDLPPDVRLMNGTATLLYALLALAAAAVVLHWAVRQPAFALRGISVHGEVARNSVSTIRSNALPRLSGTFFTLDLKQAQQAFESVPWVRHAVLHRVWPNRLAVQLEEHRPVALWGEGEDTRKLVNHLGEVFEANLGDVEDDGLPTLQGPDGSAPSALALFGRLKPVLAKLDQAIDTLALSGRGSWRAGLADGASIELGRGSEDDVVARAERFAATVTQVTSRYQRPIEYADLRHRDGYALRLRGVTTTLVVPPPAPAAAAPARAAARTPPLTPAVRPRKPN